MNFTLINPTVYRSQYYMCIIVSWEKMLLKRVQCQASCNLSYIYFWLRCQWAKMLKSSFSIHQKIDSVIALNEIFLMFCFQWFGLADELHNHRLMVERINFSFNEYYPLSRTIYPISLTVWWYPNYIPTHFWLEMKDLTYWELLDSF